MPPETGLRIGVAGIPGAWSTQVLCDRLRVLGVRAFAFNLGDCLLDFSQGTVLLDGRDLGRLHAVVAKKLGHSTDAFTPTRVAMLRQLETRGVRTFSPAGAIDEANDRFRMTQRLTASGLPVPRTVIVEGFDDAAEVVEAWQRVVIKPRFTSKGRGMLLLASDGAYRIKLRRWQREWRSPYYLQEFVPHAGRDIGVAVLGGEILGAYYRVGRPDRWLTTTAAGGHYQPAAVDHKLAQIVRASAAAFGLDFTVVDLVEAASGYLVYEVSAFGGFAGLSRAHGIDAAGRYADYVVRTVRARLGAAPRIISDDALPRSEAPI
jgi:ribosomal protein S6--L-glutamate ligase